MAATIPASPSSPDQHCASRLYLVWFASFALSCNLAVEFGFPLKSAVWVCLAASLLGATAYYAVVRPRFDFRVQILVLLLGVVAAVLGIAPFLARGLHGSLGTEHADGWNHVARGLFVWDYAWGTQESLPVIYKYATHLAGTRWGASSLIAGLSVFTGFGDPASALTLFFILTACATFVSYWMLGTELFTDWRVSLASAVFASTVSWTPQILNAGNFENSLFNVYPPALCAILLSLKRRPQNLPDACLAAVCGAAAFSGYPEGTAILSVLLLPFVAVSITGPRWAATTKGFFVPSFALFALLVSPAALRFAHLVAMRWGSAVAEPAASGLRPGETLFPGLLSNHALAAFCTFGAHIKSPTWLHLLGAYLVLPLLIALGLWRLARCSRAIPAAAAVLAVLAGGFGAVLHYDYGVYKVANIGAFIWSPVVFAGLVLLIRVESAHRSPPPQSARLALLGFGVIAASWTKAIQTPSIKLVPRDRFETLALDPRLAQAGEVVIHVGSAMDQLWSTYFLRQVPLSADKWLSYLGQPHVLPFINAAQKPRPGAPALYLVEVPNGQSRSGGSQLQFVESASVRLLRIENPYGLERFADGRSFLWIGPESVRFHILSPEARAANLRCDQFIFGANSPDSGSLSLEVTDAQGTRTVVIAPTDHLLPLQLAKGAQEIVVRCTTPPKSIRHANGDTRKLLLGMLAPRVE